MEQAEQTRQKAVNLRGTLDAILTNASRDLRTQADKVEAALARKIACTDELIVKMEMELKKVQDNQTIYGVFFPHAHVPCVLRI